MRVITHALDLDTLYRSLIERNKSGVANTKIVINIYFTTLIYSLPLNGLLSNFDPIKYTKK